MDLLTDPWVIGVGGGLISGLLVTIITRFFFSNRDRKEYRQRVETANNEIMYSVRPLIAEKMLPTCDILDSLLSATARKYALDIGEVYDARTLGNDLISEIMGNSFLSSQQKLDFCDFVSQLKTEDMETKIRRLHSRFSADDTVHGKFDTTRDLSIMVGLTAGVTFVLSTVIVMGDGTTSSLGMLSSQWLAPLLSTIGVSFALTVSILLARRYKKLRSRQNHHTSEQAWLDTPAPKKNEDTTKVP